MISKLFFISVLRRAIIALIPVMKSVFFSIYIYIKSVFLWLLVKENREIGIKYTKKAIVLAEIVSKQTKTTKDDKAVEYIAKQFDKAVKVNRLVSKKEISSAAKAINKISSGDLSDVSIGVSKDGVRASIGDISAKYNPSNGSVNFGLKLKN